MNRFRPFLPIQFDLETTGVDINTANIVQLAAVVGGQHPDLGSCDPKTIMMEYANPGSPIDPGASEVHGITDDMVKDCPPQEQVVQQFYDLLEEYEKDYTVILSGHNVERYDIPIIKRILPEAFDKFDSCDTYTYAMRTYPDREHKLGLLFNWLVKADLSEAEAEKLLAGAHDADADCHMCAHILTKFLNDSGQNLEQFTETQIDPQILALWPWGKYKGTPIDAVPKSYINWCRKNYHDVHKDIEATIVYLLGDK